METFTFFLTRLLDLSHIHSTKMMNGTLTKENSFVKNRAKLFSCKSEEEPLNNEVSEKKTPSYVSLSCAVSGYSGLNRYDSRARQEISRSRDSSRDATRLPLCLNKSRDSSPVRARYELKTRKSSGGILLSDITVNAANPIEYQQQQNQQWNGRSKSVDRGYLRQNFLNGYLQYKPPTNPTSTTNNEERGRVRIRSSTVPHQGTQQDSKSVIQQRIERLYGPAALAGGFFLVKSPLKSSKEPLKRYSEYTIIAFVHENIKYSYLDFFAVFRSIITITLKKPLTVAQRRPSSAILMRNSASSLNSRINVHQNQQKRRLQQRPHSRFQLQLTTL